MTCAGDGDCGVTEQCTVYYTGCVKMQVYD